MQPDHPTFDQLRAENEALRARLEESEETLRALRSGEVDALVVGEQLYTLQGVDSESNRVRGEIIAQIYEAVIAVDNDRRVIYLNPAAERLYGVAVSDALGKQLPEIVEVRWPTPQSEAMMRQALRERGQWRGENIHVRRDGGEIQVESTMSRLLNVEGAEIGVLMGARDITERKQLQTQLATTTRELERHAVNLEALVVQRTAKLNETVQELEAFSFTIAHDMRAPLRAMQGFSQILEEEYAPSLDENAHLYLARIRKSASRLDELIRDVLQFSRIVRGELALVPVNTEELLDEIIGSYPNFQGADIGIEIVRPLPAVLASPAALTQVFSNLLGNAVKFVKPGIAPRVRVWAEPGSPDPGVVRFWVEDNGIGIEAESKERIFGMFQRLNRPALYEGTGIGLAIVRKAVERMGGIVDVESEPGKGSRFWVQLKRA